MSDNINLENAVEIAENAETAFIVEGKRLHAVDPRVANLKKEKCKPEQLMPMMFEALNALIVFAEGKVPPHFIEIAKKVAAEKTSSQLAVVSGVLQIYSHLHHQDRNKLSGLVHHAHQTQG